jgi:hypothetical protein
VITVKQGDTHATVWRANADLTGAAIRLLAVKDDSTVTVLAATVTDGPTGEVTHMLTGDLAVGTYQVELEVTKAGVITTFPNSGFAELYVHPDIR